MDAVETMAYAGQVPWHGLGVKVDHNLSVEEMIKVAGLDWETEKCQMSYEFNGQRVNSPKHALVRQTDGMFLSSVSDGWTDLQNHKAFDFFDDFVKAGKMTMHTAGSLQNGKYVWVLAKLNEAFEPVRNDLVQAYLLLVNPHLYGNAISYLFTPTRVVCWNTMSAALSEIKQEQILKVSHNQNFIESEAKQAVKIMKERMIEYKEKATFLAKKTYTEEQAIEFFAEVFPKTSTLKDDGLSRNALKAIQEVKNQPGDELGEGTFWELFNKVTYMTDHELGNSQDTRLTSAWFGVNRSRKAKALNIAVEMAK